MAVKYQTGVSTLAQFIVMVILNFVGGITGTAQQCSASSSDCVGNIILSLLFFLLISFWFGFVWILGYSVQDRRNKRLAQLLVATEAMILLVSLFDAKHHPNILGLLTSLTDAGFAIWTIVLAWRLVRANGGRVTTRHHPVKHQ